MIYAHKREFLLKANLGVLAGTEDNVHAKSQFTQMQKQAEEFVNLTGIDSLAVANWQLHGAYKFSHEAKLNLEKDWQKFKI